MSDPLDDLDYYTLLQVPRSAQADAIRAAFHTFALKFHPDNHVAGGAEKLARANHIYRRGAEAYRVLLEPEARSAYDAQLARGDLRYRPESGAAGSTPSGTPRRVGLSPGARPFFTRAQQAVRAQDWKQARLNLQIALGHDPDHPELLALRERIEAGSV